MLWKKVAPSCRPDVSVGGHRIIVQRERERMAFRSAGYWDVTAELDTSVSDAQASPPRFTAKLSQVDGRRVAAGRDFDSLGVVRKPDEVLVLDEVAAGQLAAAARCPADGVVGRAEPYTPQALCAVHDLDPAAGRPQAGGSPRSAR